MVKYATYEKATHSGNNVSHSHRGSNRIWKVDVELAKVKTEGGIREIYVCTSCLRSNFAERV